MGDAPFGKDALIRAYTEYDSGVNDGKGQSDNADSGSLGWGESGFLDAYIKLYETTGNTRWLDKMVRHFDSMMGNMKDHFGDGYGTWVTPTYSVALIRTGAMHNQGTGKVGPQEDRVWTSRGGDAIGDSIRVIEILPGRKVAVTEYGTRKVLKQESLRPGVPLEAFAPFKVTIEGKTHPGDRFWVQTFAGEPLEYLVHQGMFLYPLSRFIEHALKKRALKARYGKKAKAYLDLIGKLIADKHERDWVDTGTRTGGYRFSPWLTERFPNRIMPHNQYLSLARAYLALQTVSRKRLYVDRAEKMARNFKKHLWKTGNAYTWYYWDWIEEGEHGHSAIEDTSHGHIDIGFAIDACRRGVVFTKSDLKRFSHTLLGQMWNGSLEDPVVGGRVNTKEGDVKTIPDWIDLCQWNPRVWDVMWASFCKQGQPAAVVPSILQGWARLQEGKIKK
ncbi:MAG: hypothetical protein O2954_11945 [bacterium]|nr:hypothetical protein [bacterium]